MCNTESIQLIRNKKLIRTASTQNSIIFGMDVEKVLDALPEEPLFDLVVTSPPYDIGKEYEKRMPLEEYVLWQKRIINKIYPRLKDTGSICWEVGNYINNGDKRRFSGRYEVIMWYTKTDDYFFDLDSVRIPAKYPGKRHFKGPNKGELSGNPLGKNPEDVWDIPNVKSNHVEKTIHPCQFPVGLIERLVLSMAPQDGLVFDPFAGVASSGVAALMNNRHFWGCEIVKEYIDVGMRRLQETLDGTVKYRPSNKPLYDPSSSRLSEIPNEWK